MAKHNLVECTSIAALMHLYLVAMIGHFWWDLLSRQGPTKSEGRAKAQPENR